MKKIVLFISLLLIPFMVKASEVKVDNFYMNATVELNGDLTVEEYFYASGDYNGYQRDIYFKNTSAFDFNASVDSYGGSSLHNGSGIELLSIKGLDRNTDFSFEKIDGVDFKKVDFADNGDSYKYIEDNKYDGVGYRMYLPSKNNQAFYLKYRIKNMGIKHNDVAELGWNIFSNQFIDDIDNLVVYVNLPNNENEIRVWGHGPLNGETKIINKNKVKLTINDLKANTAIDIRLTFDKNVIKNSNKNSNVNALDKILKYEQNEAEKANYLRQQEDIKTEQMIKDELDNPNFNRDNYNIVESLITDLHNKELVKKYTDILISKQDLSDKNEVILFNEIVKLSNANYKNYEKANRHYENIFSIKTKEEIKIKLDKYLVKVKNREKTIDTIGELTILIFLVLSIYFTYKYFKQKYKSVFKEKYFRDFPSDLNPGSVDYLYHKKATKLGISANILDMIDQNKITITKAKRGYDLTRENNICDRTTIESKSVDILFGTKTSVNTKKPRTASYSEFNSYKYRVENQLRTKGLLNKNDINEEFKMVSLIIVLSIFFLPFLYYISLPVIIICALLCFFKANNKNKLLYVITIIVSIISSIIVGSNNHFYKNTIVLCFISIIVILILKIYTSIKEKLNLTEQGIEELSKWKALRRYMKDFTLLDRKELPEVRLWNKYLVYATALGVGDKVSKALKVYIETEGLNTNDFLMNYTITNSLNHNINSSMRRAYQEHYASSSSSGGSSWSSGSGSGGGFSGGGGSFGGGSGGGHF